MVYLALFQHAGYKGVNKFPLAMTTLEEPPQVEDAFLINNAKDRLWEIKEIDIYKPIKLNPSIFESIFVCGINLIDLPSGFDYRDYANIDMESDMFDIGYEEDTPPGSIWSIEYWKDGIISSESSPLVIGARS